MASQEEAQQRVRRLQVVLSCGLLATLIVAPRLWFAHPLFSPQPLLPWALPSQLDTPIYVTLIGLLLPIIAGWHPDRFMAVWCGMFGLRAAFDFTLWQPYLYQYAAMMLALRLIPRAEGAVNANRLILVSTYLWSGLNKINHRFFEAGLAAIPGLEIVLAPILDVPNSPLGYIGVAVPFIEIFIAVGLLVDGKARRIAMVAAIAMHALIFVALGPLGANHNVVVWPWNVAMMALVVVLFGATGEGDRVDLKKVLWNSRSVTHGAIVVLFLLCPLLGAFGLWPVTLSFRLYSYRVPTADVYVTEALRDRLPAATQKLIEPVSVTFDAGRKLGPYVGGLNISDWSERELGAFLPPEVTAYEATFAKVCTLAADPEDGLLLSVSPPDILSGQTRQAIATCRK